MTGFRVYGAIDREFFVDDLIQFTAPDKSMGVAHRDLAEIRFPLPKRCHNYLTHSSDGNRSLHESLCYLRSNIRRGVIQPSLLNNNHGH